MPRPLLTHILTALLAVLAVMPTFAQSDPAIPEIYNGLSFIRNSRHLDTSGAWIQPGTTALKFYVSYDGIHKLTHEWLSSAGINPATMDVDRFQLVRNGEIQPVFAIGLTDQSFDVNDAILFIGTRNYDSPDYYAPVPQDTPHPEYLNKYSDSSAYWLILDVQPSPRFEMRNIGISNTDTVTSHRRKVHYERDISLQFMGTNVDRLNLAEWTREDTWIMQFIQPDQTKTLPFELTNYIPGNDPVARVAVAGYQGPSGTTFNHKLNLRLQGGDLIDSLSFNSDDHPLLEGTIRSAAVANGSFLLEVESANIQPTFTRCVIDNYEIEYDQRLMAVNDSLIFSEPITNSSTAYINISGINDTNCIVLCDDISTGYALRPTWVSEGGLYAAVFPDSIASDKKWYLSSIAAARVPGKAAKAVQADLRAQLPDVDWLALTARSFTQQVEAYASFIQSEYGASTAVTAVEDIYDSYSYGVFNPEAIRLYLYDVFRNRTPSETLPYVALIGDANYNFKEKSPKYGENFVPGYGFPVSDMLFVTFDSLGLYPAANVGRLPIRSVDELAAYQERHADYRTLGYDEWNKTVLMVSGGNSGENDAQLAFYMNINQHIVTNSVLPAPFGGQATHIYKTASPPSPFGEYSEDEARAILLNGGIAISYVGHSATATWDNGIDDPSWLASTDAQNPPLVTDFGCSSGKFAESNLISFSEQFVIGPEAPGLVYIGNAAFGYRSTAQSFPDEFYRILLNEGVTSVSGAHFLAKKAMVERFGENITIRNAVQMSTLLGDPILQLALPGKPDAAMTEDDIRTEPAVFTDAADSLRFEIDLHNYGIVPQKPLSIAVSLMFDGQETGQNTLDIPFPLLLETITIAFPSPKTTGDYTLMISLDPGAEIDELSESNNNVLYRGHIVHNGPKIVNRNIHSSGQDSLVVLNPYLNPGNVTGIILESDISPDFNNPETKMYPYGETVSYLSPLPAIPANQKRYIRLKLDGVNGSYSNSYIIWNGPRLPFYQKDSSDWSSNAITNLSTSNQGVTTYPANRNIGVVSAGPFDGSLADVLMNGASVFPPVAIQGYYVAVFQRDSMLLKETRTFSSAQSAAEADSLAAFISARQPGELIALASSSDPTINKDRFSEAFGSIGAVFVDSVQEQGSYALIGAPGLAPGQANEALTGPMEGAAAIDTLLSAPPTPGFLITDKIGPAGTWRSIDTWTEGSLNSSSLRVIGVQHNGSKDTVLETLIGQTIDISHIDAAVYPYLILDLFLENSDFGAPKLRAWGVNYQSAPELAVNYQSVYPLRDSVFAGEAMQINYTCYNAGESPLPELQIEQNEVHSGNGGGNTSSFAVPPLQAHQNVSRTLEAARYSSPGTVDAAFTAGTISGEFHDQFAANNAFTITYTVVPDSSEPDLAYTFDSVIPMDGDFISPTPAIRLELSSATSPILDADAFRVSIDGQQVPTAGQGASFTPSSQSEPAVLELHPSLEPGSHEFRINAVNASGVMAYSEDAVLNLTVSSGTIIRDLYPVPNPLTDRTTFTFALGGSELPEEGEIKIYTIAGRLIRTISIPQPQLRIGTNHIPWDGRDEDGDRLANGTYFFRLNIQNNSTRTSSLGKLSVLR